MVEKVVYYEEYNRNVTNSSIYFTYHTRIEEQTIEVSSHPTHLCPIIFRYESASGAHFPKRTPTANDRNLSFRVVVMI